MAVKIGHAANDENRGLKYGKAGDQTKREVSTRDWYLHKKGWVLLRPKSSEAAEKIAKAMSNVQSHATSNPNTIAQYAALAALTGPTDELEQMILEFPLSQS